MGGGELEKPACNWDRILIIAPFEIARAFITAAWIVVSSAGKAF